MSTTMSLAPQVRERSAPPAIAQQAAWPHRPLRIGVVNNMPDPALGRTEHQFCALLHAASAGLVVEVTFYALAGVPRGEVARAHIAQFYEGLAELEKNPPDGLIVTGTEPKAARFEDEAFWPCMSRLIDVVDDAKLPTIWSCLAAHAAVHHRDAIERLPLKTKLSGVFECRIAAERNPILHRAPRSWRVPHSRRNGLDRTQLIRHGYDILSASPRVGVDMFAKHDESLQLYLQGHPEYDPGTLIAEYRRDVSRQRQNPGAKPPSPPVGLLPEPPYPMISSLIRRPIRLGATAPGNGAAEPELKGQDFWSDTARLLFENWLTYLDASRHAGRRLQSILPSLALIDV